MSFSKTSEFVQEALTIKSAGQNVSHAVIWGCFNSVILTVFFYDLHNGGYTKEHKFLWWCAASSCLLCTINIILHLKSYFATMIALRPLEVTDKQRKLLSISDSDPGFRTPIPKQSVSTPVSNCSPKLSDLFEATIRTPPPRTLNTSDISSPNKSWFGEKVFGSSTPSGNTSIFSNSSLSPVLSLHPSANASSASPTATANSWSFHANQSGALSSSYNVMSSPKRTAFSPSQLADSFANKSLNSLSPFSSSPLNLSSRTDAISSRDELDQYLREFHEKERKKQILSQNENSNGGSNSLWAYSGSSNASYDFINTLKQNVYQVAIKDAGSESNSSLSKMEGSKMTYYSSVSVSKIWLKRDVTPKDLFQFEENVRIWISMNILQPLVKLINSCNDDLVSVAPELKVGNVGVDKLRKASQNISGMKQLNYLLPFLDVTLHQDYLVQRIRELSRGGAISSFMWNAGGSFNGKPWRDEYPTDSYILFHLFSMYMDNHLPPDPTQPDGRVFSNVHIVKTPEKPSTPTTHPYLYLTQINPPHLKVVLPPDEECEVGAGHKNFLHSLILFCHHLVHQQHSHIAGVNLKLSGINLAWVVNRE